MAIHHARMHALQVHALSAALALALSAHAGTAAPAREAPSPAAQALPLPPDLAQRTQDFAHFRAGFARGSHVSGQPGRTPTTLAVHSLADSGQGSLREVLAATVDGDTIDLRALEGRIILSAALVAPASITIQGPGRDRLTIDAAHRDRVISAAGSLSLSSITLANGAAPGNGPALGGCLQVPGNVVLEDATVTACTVGNDQTRFAYGGGVAAGGTAYIKDSTISDNTATAYQGAIGGGIVSQGNLTIVRSTISGNHADQVLPPPGAPASDSSAFFAAGGGVATPDTGSVTYLSQSRLSGNSISASGGAYTFEYGGNTYTTQEDGHAYGGGSFSAVSSILNTTITANSASANGNAHGGGVFLGSMPVTAPRPAGGPSGPDLAGSPTTSLIQASEVAANQVISSGDGNDDQNAFGGGIALRSPLTIIGSAVNNNSLTSLAAYGRHGAGGGIIAMDGTLEVIASTISGNTAAATVGNGKAFAGGIAMFFGVPLTLTNSTVSGNLASAPYSAYAGGIGASTLQITGSTIAFNSAQSSAGGLSLYGNAPSTKTIRSTIIASNDSLADPGAADVGAVNGTPVEGDHNLVVASWGANWSVAPMTSDPLLLPLAFNGGPTKTHALAAASPAIDAGSNPLALGTDQRGYARVVGPGADIGAFELDHDHIFTNGFDSGLGGP